MTSSEGADWGVLAAILAMALATYAMRAGGFWLMGNVPPSPRLKRMLEALPGSVVAARCCRSSCATAWPRCWPSPPPAP
jgi:uncharacterized membrane protein